MILVRTQKEVRNTEKAFILANSYVNMNRICREIFKVLLVRSQVEMSNMLLETESKMMLVIKWQRT